jgi:hypothetical protein
VKLRELGAQNTGPSRIIWVLATGQAGGSQRIVSTDIFRRRARRRIAVRQC